MNRLKVKYRSNSVTLLDVFLYSGLASESESEFKLPYTNITFTNIITAPYDSNPDADSDTRPPTPKRKIKNENDWDNNGLTECLQITQNFLERK